MLVWSKMNVLFKFFLQFCLWLQVVFSLKCHNVRKFPHSNLTNFFPDCNGDVCAIWKNRQDQQVQSCLTGYPFQTMKMGCRVNYQGALFCMCADKDHCNAEDMLKITQAESLPLIRCRNFLGKSSIAKHRRETYCFGHACFYRVNKVLNFKGQLEVQNTADCSEIPDQTFDIHLASLWPGPGVISGHCSQLQYTANETILGCMCNTSDCNQKLPFPIEAQQPSTVCHWAYNSPSDTSNGGTCRGQYCFIQRTTNIQNPKQVSYTKGCLTVSSQKAVMVGYRNVMNVTEQWICDTGGCNQNVETAKISLMRQRDSAAAGLKAIMNLVFLVSIVLMTSLN